MRIDFAHSEASTIGVEWEIALADQTTCELTSAADLIFQDLPNDDIRSHVTRELLQNTVEIVTGVHHRVDEATAQIDEVASAIEAAALPHGIGAFCAGTHPYSQALAQPVTQTDRYRKLIDRTQWWGRAMLIYGLHVHVGIDERAKALPIAGALLTYLPHLLALSASSPWWQGELTGYASNRTMYFQQLPTAGLPPELESWSAYEQYVSDHFATGIIDNINELRFDVRVAPVFGTVESRICDGTPTLSELASITALIQCLVDYLSRQLDEGATLLRLPDWQLRENKWRAARYGLATSVITGADNREADVIDDTLRLLNVLEPTAARLGCSAELAGVTSILEDGASYQRQTRVARDGDLSSVVKSLIAEFAARRPLPDFSA